MWEEPRDLAGFCQATVNSLIFATIFKSEIEIGTCFPCFLADEAAKYATFPYCTGMKMTKRNGKDAFPIEVKSVEAYSK